MLSYHYYSLQTAMFEIGIQKLSTPQQTGSDTSVQKLSTPVGKLVYKFMNDVHELKIKGEGEDHGSGDGDQDNLPYGKEVSWRTRPKADEELVVEMCVASHLVHRALPSRLHARRERCVCSAGRGSSATTPTPLTTKE